MINVKYTVINTDTLIAYTKNGTYTYDNPIQRGYVWKRDKKSLLIHSIIFGFPVPTIYANYVNRVYDIFDGKQRCNTITEYVENKFKLSFVPNIDLNGEEYVLAGKYFKDLDEEFQNRIMTFTLTVAYGENLSQNELREMFIRLNSGKPLSATEMLKAKTKAGSSVLELSKHRIFALIMSKNDIEASKNISFVHQTYAMLFLPEGQISLLNSQLTKIFSDVEISDEQKNKIKECYDVFADVFETLLSDKKENQQHIAILKRKVHFISMVSVIKKVIEEKPQMELLINWIKYFFAPEAGITTIDKDYNDNLVSGINRPLLVSNRKNAIVKNFLNYCKGGTNE